MTPVVAARSEAIFRVAQDRIKHYILDARLGPGDPLPTEHALSRALGISRNSLREALKALETVGVIETRHGIGAFVGRASLDPLIAGMTFNLAQRGNRDIRTLRETLELREILEAELVQRAIGLHSPEQLARLAGIVAEMEADAERETPDPEIDRAFHDSLYAPLDNGVVTLVLHAFWDVQRAVEAQLPRVPHLGADNARWHRNILEAIRRGDREAAAAAMREQFTGAWNHIVLGAVQSPAPRDQVET